MAIPTIAKANVALGLDPSGLLTGLKSASIAVDKLSKSIGKVGKDLSKLGALITGFGTSIIGALSVASIKMAEYGDIVAKTTKRSGLLNEEISALIHGALLTGTTIKAFERAIRGMDRATFDALRNQGEMKDALKQLGLQFDDIINKTPIDQFLLLSEALHRTENFTLKAGIAMRIFGRSGSEIIPLMDELGKPGAFKALQKEAEALGILFDEQTAKISEDLLDAISRLKGSLLGLTLTIGRIFNPTISEVVKRLTQAIILFRRWIDENPELIDIMKRLALRIIAVGSAISSLGVVFLILSKLLSPSGFLAAALISFALLNTQAKNITKVFKEVVEDLSKLLGSDLSVILNIASSLFESLWNNIKFFTSEFIIWLIDVALPTITKAILQTMNAIISKISDVIEIVAAIMTAVSVALGFFTGGGSLLVAGAATGLREALKKALPSAVKKIGAEVIEGIPTKGLVLAGGIASAKKAGIKTAARFITPIVGAEAAQFATGAVGEAIKPREFQKEFLKGSEIRRREFIESNKDLSQRITGGLGKFINNVGDKLDEVKFAFATGPFKDLGPRPEVAMSEFGFGTFSGFLAERLLTGTGGDIQSRQLIELKKQTGLMERFINNKPEAVFAE